MQCFPKFVHLKKLPTRSAVIIQSEWIWGPLTRNLTKVRLRGFLYKGTIAKKISLRFLNMWFLFCGFLLYLNSLGSIVFSNSQRVTSKIKIVLVKIVDILEYLKGM